MTAIEEKTGAELPAALRLLLEELRAQLAEEFPRRSVTVAAST